MKTILYFVADPTLEQLAFAKNNKMTIRNPQAYSASDYIELCDEVYGDVPQAYLDKFPLFELPSTRVESIDFTELKNDELKALLRQREIDFPANAKRDTLVALLIQNEQNLKE